MKAVIIKNRGNIDLGKIRTIDIPSGEVQDLFHDWPAGSRSVNERLLPDGAVYGLEERRDEATGQYVFSSIYKAMPSTSSPWPIQSTNLSESFLYSAPFDYFDSGQILAAPDGSFIVIRADTATPTATRQVIGSFLPAGNPGVVSFADGSARFVFLDASTLKCMVSTELGLGPSLNTEMTFDFEIPSPSLPAPIQSNTPFLAIGAAACSLIMQSLSVLGEPTSMTAWLAVNDPQYGRIAQVYKGALCGTRSESGTSILGAFSYPSPGWFTFLDVEPDGNFSTIYEGAPEPPVLDPADPTETYGTYQVIINREQQKEIYFWKNLVRSFETADSA